MVIFSLDYGNINNKKGEEENNFDWLIFYLPALTPYLFKL